MKSWIIGAWRTLTRNNAEAPTNKSARRSRNDEHDWGPAMLAFEMAALGVLMSAFPVRAQEYPSRPVRLLVGFAPGSATDIAARAIAERLSDQLKAPFIVENKPGAGSLIAIQALKSSQADGYSLMLSAGSALVQNPGIRRDLPYDPVRDFAPIAPVFKLHGVLVVNPGLPAHNIAQLVELLKKSPGKLSYGSSGIGMANHLGMELLLAKTGTEMTHVPYKGDNQVAADVVAGRLDVAIETLSTAMPLIQSGKQRALAVLSTRAVPMAAGLPTLGDAAIPGLEALEPFTFVGLVGPAGMSADRIKKINEAVNESLKSPQLASRLAGMGFEPMADSPEGFGSYMGLELAKWREIGSRLRIQ
ncbi:MAG: tripartite tricarboxylate transporter substrate binding protein [Proteobacteria bacterium]|nr:tripartite tricarboxylate transporter substrate binding protein [Pseudomonadota bacterium]